VFSKKDSEKYNQLSAKLVNSINAKTKDKKKAAAYIYQLKEVLDYHDWRYYVINDPIIDDYTYDQLFKKT